MTESKRETFEEIAGWLKDAPVGDKVKVVPETGEAFGIIKRDKTGWYWDDNGTPFSLHNVYIAATFQRIEENPHPKGTGAWAAGRGTDMDCFICAEIAQKVREERERCAMIADGKCHIMRTADGKIYHNDVGSITAFEIAAAIRKEPTNETSE